MAPCTRSAFPGATASPGTLVVTLFGIALLAVALGACDTGAEGSQPVRVSGTVLHMSRGGEPMEGLRVVLYGDFPAAALTPLAETMTDAGGASK